MQVTTAPKSLLHCSFCGIDRNQVPMLVAGPGGIHICDACVALCHRMLTGKTTAAFAGWKALTDDELLAALPASSAAVDAVEQKLREHVTLLRDRGLSWERIAAALGVTRQAAWERFSRES
jgi:ATP-dependent Clp protease ATP-binding subunit ClpX